jgi:hypothetical protein
MIRTLIAPFSAAVVLVACGGGGAGAPPDTHAGPPPAFSIGGTVTGLAVGNVVDLADSSPYFPNGMDALTAMSNGSFRFNLDLPTGATYAVTVVMTQPVAQNCSVGNGTGTVALADVTNVVVTCP